MRVLVYVEGPSERDALQTLLEPIITEAKTRSIGLGTSDALRGQWRQPVEDQNDTKPPKRIVEDLFRRYRKRQGYLDMVDAPWILKRASLETIVGACPQRFEPFVSDLRVLAGGRDPVTQAPETIPAAKSGSPSSDG